MKTTLLIMTAIAMTCSLAACKTTIRDDEVSVQTRGSNGDFCPPGQAKKGNC